MIAENCTNEEVSFLEVLVEMNVSLNSAIHESFPFYFHRLRNLTCYTVLVHFKKLRWLYTPGGVCSAFLLSR